MPVAKSKTLSAKQRLAGFIAKFDAPNQKLIRAVRRILRRRFPTATELVYDNYNFLVIGYGPTERPSEAIISLAAAANGVGLCFIHGARLPDPAGVLQGAGKQTRFLRLPSVHVLAKPAVQALLTLAENHSKIPMPAKGKGRLIIRSVSAKQRPRRRAQDRPAAARKRP